MDLTSQGRLLAAALLAAAGLLVAGFWLVAPAAGLICAGVTLAAWSLLVLTEVS